MVTACVDLLQERKADPRCCFTLWVCGLFRLHGKGACSDLVSAVKPCSCAICCGPTSPVVGALQPHAGAGAMVSPLQNTRGEEGRGVGQRLQLAGGPAGALASRHRLALPAPL